MFADVWQGRLGAMTTMVTVISFMRLEVSLDVVGVAALDGDLSGGACARGFCVLRILRGDCHWMSSVGHFWF